MNSKRFLLSLLYALLPFFDLNALTEQPIVVVIPSYNNICWYKNNLDSIFSQQYSNYRIIYIDDCSDDNTGNAVAEYIATNRLSDKCTLIRNPLRVGAMKNLYDAITSTHDDEIVAIVDGDDRLYDNQVFNKVNAAYSSGNVWYTHGRLITEPEGLDNWCLPIPPKIIRTNTYRWFRCPTHLRTFYSWLFKLIKKQDFMYEGSFFPMTYDMAIMFPIAEMASERHAFIPDLTYIYNRFNPINDNKVSAEKQRFFDRHIRNKPKYKRLAERPCAS